MTECFSIVTKAENIRCRPEGEGHYLFYNPRTDELHMLDERGKRIFDLCDGRPISDVVHDGCALLDEQDLSVAPAHLLNFLCALRKRDLVVMR